MSLEQKVGQMFLVSFIGTKRNDKMISFLKQGYFGNVLLYGDNIQNASQLKELNQNLKQEIIANTKIPPFIAVDHEGGNVIRLHDEVTAFPSSMAFTAASALNEVYNLGKYMAQELNALGININFAPVLDVNNNPLNPIINSRAFSDNPKQVYTYAKKVIQGMQENGLLACGKHFPGHGDTHIDSHFGLPQINKTKNEIINTELYPFIKAINSGLNSIMTAHILYPTLDKNNVPATMSKVILTDLLRYELNFQGLVFSDSMQMAAIKEFYGIGKASVEAIKAGVDIILSGINDNDDETNKSQLEAYKIVLSNVKSGEIPLARINESVARILEFKYKYLFNTAKPAKPNLKMNLGLAQKVSEKAITLIKDNLELLPLIKEKVLVISASTTKPLGGKTIQGVNHNTFAYKVATALNGDYKIVGMNPSKEEIESILAVVSYYNKIIIATNNAKVYPKQVELINAVLERNVNIIAVATCSPYDILEYPKISTYICTYDYNSTTVKSLNKLLKGEIQFVGKLPVKLNM